MGEFNVSASTPSYTNNTTNRTSNINSNISTTNNTNTPVNSNETNPAINTNSFANVRFNLNTVNPEKPLSLNFPTFENRNNNNQNLLIPMANSEQMFDNNSNTTQRIIPLDDDKFKTPTFREALTEKIDSLPLPAKVLGAAAIIAGKAAVEGDDFSIKLGKSFKF